MHTILIAGAALVGLPILLHLIMKQEPKRLTFPAFRFLKQKLKTNQRKLRLRHFILLALRMLIIALFCLTLYQPTFKSDRLNIRGEQPIAVVMVIDTTPSMGYIAGDKTRLDDARRRALELLEELPDKSPIAVVDTTEMAGYWLPDHGSARRRIEELKETRGGQPVNAAIGVAYQLLAKVDQETESTESLSKLVVVFTDRTAASWDANRTEDLKRLRESIPRPLPHHVVLDFGIDAPTNVGILAAEMKPQVISANQTATVSVTVGATGGDGTTVNATILARPGWNAKPEHFTMSRDVAIPAGQTRTAVFEFRDLKPGLHQIEFSLSTPDKLALDDTRYLTFKVGEARRILTISDNPNDAAFWQAAHAARVPPEFACLVVTPDRVQVDARGNTIVKYPPNPLLPSETVTDDIRSFEAVCMLNVNNPNAPHPTHGTLWDRLRPYLRTGGKLIVMPGPDTFVDLGGYNAAQDVMPAQLLSVVRTRDLDPPPQEASNWPAPRDGKTNGVTWVLDEQALKHPMLQIIEEWMQREPRLDIVADPRMTKKYWMVDPHKTAATVVSYFNAKEANSRHPAILERAVLDPKDNNRAKGKVVLLTTRMDGDDTDEKDRWNDYWSEESTFFATFPYLLVRYLAGDTADANFNYIAGATVNIPLPRGKFQREDQVVFDGPPGTFVGSEAIVSPGETQSEIRLGPPKTSTPGNFTLTVESDREVIWQDGFSMNIPAEESDLRKVPVEMIEELTDKDRVFAIDRNSTLRDWLDVALGQPIDLFPWLLICVLLLFVVEGLAANRFYRKPRM